MGYLEGRQRDVAVRDRVQHAPAKLCDVWWAKERMGLRVYEAERAVAAIDWPLMRRGTLGPPFSACAWSGAKSASLALSPVKGRGGGCSEAAESRENRREGIGPGSKGEEADGQLKLNEPCRDPGKFKWRRARRGSEGARSRWEWEWEWVIILNGWQRPGARAGLARTHSHACLLTWATTRTHGARCWLFAHRGFCGCETLA